MTVHSAPEDMRAIMATADLAVTAGGQTTYELAASGVPAVALCIAENQRPNLAALQLPVRAAAKVVPQSPEA